MAENFLTREIEIGGQKLPVWMIGAAAGGVALVVLVVNNNAQQQIAPTNPTDTPTPTQPSPNTNDNSQVNALQSALDSLSKGLQDTAAQLTGQYAAQQQRYDEMNLQNQAALQALSNQLFAALAKQRDEFAAQQTQLKTYQPYQPQPAPVQNQTNPTQPAPVNNVTPTQTQPTPTQSTDYYTVVSGDNLSRIARRFNLTLAQIKSYNPQISNPNLIHPGDIIKLNPMAGTYTPQES